MRGSPTPWASRSSEVKGRFFDGEVARSAVVNVAIEGGRLQVINASGDLLCNWPLAEVRADAIGPEARLRRGEEAGRLIVPLADWRRAAGASNARLALRREFRLVAALGALALAAGLLVFVGVPAASGPLARMTPPALEAQFGRTVEAQLSLGLRPCPDDPAGQAVLGGLAKRLAAGDADARLPIRVRVVRAPYANAMALPGGLILVTNELIDDARSPDELAGVLAHEIAHVERRHVMQAVWRAMGVGLILDATIGGGSGAGQQAVLLVGAFTDLRFSRRLEHEADTDAVRILAAQGLSARGMSELFRRWGERGPKGQLRTVSDWLSTHPDTLERADLFAHAAPGRPALSAADWRVVKQICRR